MLFTSNYSIKHSFWKATPYDYKYIIDFPYYFKKLSLKDDDNRRNLKKLLDINSKRNILDPEFWNYNLIVDNYSKNKLITENVYSDSSMRKKIGTYNQNWSLTRDSNQTAWFCIETSDNMLTGGTSEGSSKECYKINAKGDILASKVTIAPPAGNGGQTITFNSK